MNRDNNLIWENWILRGGISDINEDEGDIGETPAGAGPGGAEYLLNQFTMAVNEEEADSSLMDIWDIAQDLMTDFKVPREHLEGIMARSGTMDEEEINSILDPNSELGGGGDNVHGSGLNG